MPKHPFLSGTDQIQPFFKPTQIMKQMFSSILGVDTKETLKKAIFRFKNRSFEPYVKRLCLYETPFDFYMGNTDGQQWHIDTTDDKDWHWPEMKFMKDNMAAQGEVVLECGGHHGLTATLISKWIGPTGQLITFEPNVENAAIIQKNIGLNNLKNIRLEPKAVGAATGKIKIAFSSSNSYILKGREHVGADVPLVMLDDYASLHPTCLKIDVEGFELEVLRGARKILKTHPKLAIEVHTDMIERYGAKVKDIFDVIDDGGYEFWVQWDIDKDPVPYQRGSPITHRVHLFALPCRQSQHSLF